MLISFRYWAKPLTVANMKISTRYLFNWKHAQSSECLGKADGTIHHKSLRGNEWARTKSVLIVVTMEKNYLIKINLKHAQFQNDKQNA